MDLFCSDLDNTLIYSHRHHIGRDKVCVEMYQGREVSFMRREWVESLGKIRRNFLFVPVTTRSMEQYGRLDLGTGIPRYALVCNGGVLLRDGVKDPVWYEESLKLAEDSADGLRLSLQLLEQDVHRKFEVRFIEDLFVFTKSSRPEESVGRLRKLLDGSKTHVFQNGEKVYVLPKKLDKGTGLVRLKRILKPERVFAAGDSEFDKSMLLNADMGMCPEGLFEETGSSIIQFPREEFTAGLLGNLEDLPALGKMNLENT